MGEHTKIGWCDHTFNPWLGCTKVSVGPMGACEGCYAEHLVQNRMHRAQWGNHPRERTSEANWRQPLTWNRKAEREGTRPFVFCASLADVFDNQVPPEWRRDLFDLIRATPHLVWLLLTKRPQNIAKMAREALISDPDEQELWSVWPRNAAIGCTVVTQAEADRDLPVLLAAKAALNPAFAFVSMEPLMGAVDLTALRCVAGTIDALRGWTVHHGPGYSEARAPSKLDWIITGGESGHAARPSHPDWFRSLRDQCGEAAVPFNFKQWGEYHPADQTSTPEQAARRGGMGHALRDGRAYSFDDQWTWRVGKRLAGRALDGVIHDARPDSNTIVSLEGR